MRSAVAALSVLLLSTAAQARIETVVVTGTPLSPSLSDTTAQQSLTADDLNRFGNADTLGALDRGIAGIALTAAQNNAYQPNLFYRGFEASPLAGDAQGLAVYVNGARFNQPFGDTVNFDLLPDIAIDRITLEGANPTFGLNALAGSLSATFKTGFGFDGTNASASFGSHETRDGEGEFGGHTDNLSWYGAARVASDSGWRAHSPSNLRQIFADGGWRGGDTEVHLWFTGASNNLTGNGTSPVELLAADRHAVFTWPDTTINEFAMAGLNLHSKLSDAFSLDGAAYLGALKQKTLNGDAAELEPCGPDLCTEDGDLARDSSGNPIPDFLAGGDYAQLNRTNTSTTSSGATLQLAYAAERLSLTAGASIDRGVTAFSATSEVGTLTADRGYQGPGIVIDIAGGPIEPVAVKGRNTYTGAYIASTFDVTDALRLDASLRFNHAHVDLEDRLGVALTGTHDYSRLNPAVGLTYTLADAVALYVSYSEANRAPTPAELSCADSTSPCSLTNFFVADPDLKQVTTRTWQAGARGALAASLFGGTLGWQANTFHTDAHNDILFVSSAVLGRAFFQNVAATRRQGADIDLDWTLDDWTASLGYAYTDATFQTKLTIASEDNPFAGPKGNIHVKPGDAMPGIPANSVKALLAYHPSWNVTLAMRAMSGRVLRGDESNLNPKTAPFAVFDIAASYPLFAHAEIFGAVANVFDKTYETFGAFAPTGDVPIAQAPGAGNPRALSPAPPREFTLGLRVKF